MKAFRLALDSLRMDFNNLFMLFFVFLIFPLLASYFIIYANSIGAGDVQPKLKLEIQDEDQSELSKLYAGMFQASGIIEEDKKSDYILKLPKGFGESILSADPKAAPLLNDDAGSRTGKTIITILHDSFCSTIRRQHELNEAIVKSGLRDEEAMELLLQASGIAEKSEKMVQTEVLDTTGRSLSETTRDNISMGYIGFIVLMLSLGIPSGDIEARKNGIDRRIYSTPTRRGTAVIASFIEFGGIAALVMCAYILIHRLGGAFKGSFPIHVLIAICFFLLFTAAVSLLNSIIPKPELSSVILTLLLMIQSFSVSIGGVSGSHEISGFAAFMNQYRPDQAMIRMMNRNVNGEFSSADLLTLGAIVLSAIALVSFAAFLQNNKKEMLK